MAEFTKSHADYKGVAVFDVAEYTVGALNAVTSGQVVQPQGPKLDFFTITANAGMTTTQLDLAVRALQQLATIHIYKYTDATDDTLAVALYPTGAWSASDIDTAVTTATGHANITVSTTATF